MCVYSHVLYRYIHTHILIHINIHAYTHITYIHNVLCMYVNVLFSTNPKHFLLGFYLLIYYNYFNKTHSWNIFDCLLLLLSIIPFPSYFYNYFMKYGINLHVYMYVWMYTYIHTYTHVYTYIYVQRYIIS